MIRTFEQIKADDAARLQTRQNKHLLAVQAAEEAVPEVHEDDPVFESLCAFDFTSDSFRTDVNPVREESPTPSGRLCARPQRKRRGPKPQRKRKAKPKRPVGRPPKAPEKKRREFCKKHQMIEITAAQRLALKRMAVKSDYFTYLKYFWDTLVTEKPVWNWHIPIMCHEFQRSAENVFAGKPNEYTLVTNVPPASSKSSVFSIFNRGWIWARMPHAQMICTSHTGMLAWDLSQKARDVIQSEKYKELFPEIVLREDKNAVKMWSNTLGGWSLSVGTGSNPVGFHAHFILIDDPVDPNKAGAEASEAITVANRFITETLPNRKVDSRTTATFLTMQRLGQNDPSAYIREKFAADRIRNLILPAELSEDVYPPEFTEKYTDGLLDPVRLSRTVLDDKQQSLGQFGYAGQMQQSPIPRGGGMVKTDMMKRTETIPTPDSWKRVCRYWDKAISEKKSGCYTVGVLMGLYVNPATGMNSFYVLDVERGKWGADVREAKILSVAQRDRAIYGQKYQIGIEQEPGSAGVRDAQQTTNMLAGFRVVPEKPSGDKVTRASPFATQVAGGAVSVLSTGAWLNDYISELEHFPFSKFKDQMDATSGAFGVLVDKLHGSIQIL